MNELINKNLLEDYSNIFGLGVNAETKKVFKTHYGKSWRKYWAAYKKIGGDKKTMNMSWDEIDALLGDVISKDSEILKIKDDLTVITSATSNNPTFFDSLNSGGKTDFEQRVTDAVTNKTPVETEDLNLFKKGFPTWAYFVIGGTVLLIVIGSVLLFNKKKIPIAQAQPLKT